MRVTVELHLHNLSTSVQEDEHAAEKQKRQAWVRLSHTARRHTAGPFNRVLGVDKSGHVFAVVGDQDPLLRLESLPDQALGGGGHVGDFDDVGVDWVVNETLAGVVYEGDGHAEGLGKDLFYAGGVSVLGDELPLVDVEVGEEAGVCGVDEVVFDEREAGHSAVVLVVGQKDGLAILDGWFAQLLAGSVENIILFSLLYYFLLGKFRIGKTNF